jgi:hypothetical protein
MRKLRIKDIREGMKFWESSAQFIAIEDGHKFTDENKNDYWVVHGRNIKTEDLVRFCHIVGFSDYPQLYNYKAYEGHEDFEEVNRKAGDRGC